MSPAVAAALCLMIGRGELHGPPPPGVTCAPTPGGPSSPGSLDGVALAQVLSTPGARDGVARVALAEARDQGDSGLAGVVYTILNRLADGRWGRSVEAVLNAPHQFEPVMRAGGDWRRLPAASQADQARVDTIVNLALEGRLPDLTNGARFFQNPAIVAARARSGAVSSRLVAFGGQTPVAVIGAHSFYAREGRGGGVRGTPPSPLPDSAREALFVGVNRAAPVTKTPSAPASGPALERPRPDAPNGDPARGLFVSRDGVVRAGEP